MRRFRFWMVCSILLRVVLTGSVSAHETAPLRTIAIRVGQYPLVVSYYMLPSAGQPLEFTIKPEAGLSDTLSYQVTPVPGITVNAVPVAAVIQPDPDDPQAVSGIVNLPVTGQWLLNIEVSGRTARALTTCRLWQGRHRRSRNDLAG